MANACISLGLILLLTCAQRTGVAQTLFKVPVDVVVINAVVTDKAGKPVRDLTAADFRVYEDEELQQIQAFSMEAYGPEELKEAPTPGMSPEGIPRKEASARPRLISFVIDDLTWDMTKPNIHGSALDAVAKFIKDGMSPNDQVAIVSGSRMVKVPFSNNKEYLLNELATLPGRLNRDMIGRSFTDYEAMLLSDMETESHTPNFLKILRPDLRAFLNNRDPTPSGPRPLRPPESESALIRIQAKRQIGDIRFRYHNLLDTLRLNVRALRHFEGAKCIVLFSHGFLAPEKSDTAHQMQEVVDLALRSGIALNTVSIRDLPTSMSDDPFLIIRDEDDRWAQESPLIQMAADTGGSFSSRRNDLSKGLQEIMSRQAFVYVLTYVRPGNQAEASYHSVRLEVMRPDLTLSYRKGYYAPKEQLVFENARKADIIDALDAPGNMNEIPITLSYSYSQAEDSAYAVSFTTDVDIRGMQFQEEDARYRNKINIILAAYDEMDNFIDGTEKSIEFRLLESSHRELRTRGLSSRVRFTLPEGRYKIKAVVRENNQGKIGSTIKPVEIP